MGNTIAKFFGFTRKQEDVIPDTPGLIEVRDPNMNYNHFLNEKEDVTLCGRGDWVSTHNQRIVTLDAIGEHEVKFHLGFRYCPKCLASYLNEVSGINPDALLTSIRAVGDNEGTKIWQLLA